MKSKILMSSFGAVVALVAGVALAAGTDAVTRSTADAQADLMRTFKSPGGPPAGQVKSRSVNESYADLMRDWTGKLTKGQIVGVASSNPVVGAQGIGTEQLGRK